jgi:hypothetical protein
MNYLSRCMEKNNAQIQKFVIKAVQLNHTHDWDAPGLSKSNIQSKKRLPSKMAINKITSILHSPLS